MRAIIIDDDELNIELVKVFCERYAPNVEVVGTADHVEEGIRKIMHLKPNLLFLDVELHNLTGFDILEAVTVEHMMVVMITAHEKYAVRAFRNNVMDYLLKPLVIKDFIEAVQKCELELKRRQDPNALESKFLYIPNKDHIDMVPIESVLHLCAQGNYTQITTMTGEQYLATRPLSHFEPKLPQSIFYRVHHSHIINVNGIVRINRNRGGKVLLCNKEDIPVADSKRKGLLDRILP